MKWLLGGLVGSAVALAWQYVDPFINGEGFNSETISDAWPAAIGGGVAGALVCGFVDGTKARAVALPFAGVGGGTIALAVADAVT